MYLCNTCSFWMWLKLERYEDDIWYQRNITLKHKFFSGTWLRCFFHSSKLRSSNNVWRRVWCFWLESTGFCSTKLWLSSRFQFYLMFFQCFKCMFCSVCFICFNTTEISHSFWGPVFLCWIMYRSISINVHKQRKPYVSLDFFSIFMNLAVNRRLVAGVNLLLSGEMSRWIIATSHASSWWVGVPLQ